MTSYPHYPNGEPPNLKRTTKCCDTCRFVRIRTDRYRACTKFPMQFSEREELEPLVVNRESVCDAHEDDT